MADSLRYVLQLGDLSRSDAPRAGTKAAHLGELLSAGFRVPDGFVLTVEAFKRFLAVHGFGSSTATDEVAAATVPVEVADDVLAALARMRDAPLAVRSSGVAEDLPGASFAGQYATFLGVRGQQALLEAVTRCWSSAFSERVAGYRIGRLNGDLQPMAVLVQRLVEPDAAGVAFTANPVSGARDEVVVNAVRGLGERLVSGEAQPDEWLVRGPHAECKQAPEGAIDVDQALAIAGTARRIEGHFGVPQDIEWAIANEELFVLQARAVTALPPAKEQLPVPVDVPHGFWQREASHFPRPASPMLRGFMDLHNEAMREMFSAYGLLLESVEMREIDGWTYARAVPLGGRDRRSPPLPVMWLLARTVPELRRRIDLCRRAIRSDRHGRDIERWYTEWRPGFATRIEALATVELGRLSDPDLEAHVEEARALAAACVRVHFLLHGAMLMVLGEFAFTCRELLGWDDRRMLALLDGLSEMSSEPSRRLAKLAAIAADRGRVRELLGRLDDASTDEILAADASFAAAFRDYQRDFGCRVLGYEFIEPTLAEQPELILRLVRDQVSRRYDSGAVARDLAVRRHAAVDEARGALAGNDAGLARFERVLARAERCYPVREDSEFYTVSAPLAVVRYAALELGRRLATRGQIVDDDDVFFLTLDEALEALRDGAQRHEVVTRRRAERAWVEANPGPASYGQDPGPPPSAAALPREARFAAEAVQWVLLDRILAPEESVRVQAPSGPISGIVASSGRYSGTVRVVMNETEFAKVGPGDVLVCPITSPVWSVLFPSIGALVTDTGGILSHAAIIAREYRLPAVVGTGNATALLRDGQLVTVDGDAGLVMPAPDQPAGGGT